MSNNNSPDWEFIVFIAGLFIVFIVSMILDAYVKVHGAE